jgi:putative oxidoreductase
MTTRDGLPELNLATNLLPSAAAGATLLRLILAAYWIAHWWYKVGFEGMTATENFFIKQGLPTWLAWFDISFEVVVAACLILGLYVPLVCLVSLPILFASMIIFAGNGFYFPLGGIELPIFWALVQVVQALLGPGVFRITPPKWLPHVPVFPALGP